MKGNDMETKNNFNDQEIDSLFKAYAAQNKDKHGSDEDMFASLREDYEREKAEKAAKKKAGRNIRRRVLWISLSAAAAAIIITCAVLIPVLLKDDGPQYELLDGLYVIPVTEAELKRELGFSPVIPHPEGYTIDSYKVYKNEEGEIKAYSFHYSTKMDFETKLIDIFCVINNDFTFSMENIIEEGGKNKVFALRAVRIYIDDNNKSICRVITDTDKYIISLNKHEPDFLSLLITGLIV